MLKPLLALAILVSCAAADPGGRQFIRLPPIATGTDGVFVSEPVRPALSNWNELVVSWNFRHPAEGLSIETQVLYPGRETKWYSFGSWALDPARHPRQSVKNQRDADGTVDTDTLKTIRPGGAVRLRVTTTRPDLSVDFIGLSFAAGGADLVSLPPQTNIWGKSLEVQERTQADFPEGISEWCSPTALSMLLHYWSGRLQRPDLDYPVPEVARAVNDPNWPGTGNWPFNTAFAGSHQGLRAYVTRLGGIPELERWIGAGVPVACSVAYGWLQGRPDPGGGHLVVCIGFTPDGDVIVNDPGRRQVRQIYRRANLAKAWGQSENTIYLVHPEGFKVPFSRFHW